MLQLLCNTELSKPPDSHCIPKPEMQPVSNPGLCVNMGQNVISRVLAGQTIKHYNKTTILEGFIENLFPVQQ